METINMFGLSNNHLLHRIGLKLSHTTISAARLAAAKLIDHPLHRGVEISVKTGVDTARLNTVKLFTSA